MSDSCRQAITDEALQFNHEALVITEEDHSSTKVVFNKGHRSLDLNIVLLRDLVELGSCLHLLDQEARRVELNKLREGECYRGDICFFQLDLVLLGEHADDSSSHQEQLTLLLVDGLLHSLQSVNSLDELIVEELLRGVCNLDR